MPQVAIAVAAAAASSGAAAAIGTGIAATLAGALAAGVVSTVGSSLLLKPPKSPSLQLEAQGIVSLQRSSVEPHKVIYGTRRVGGNVVFMDTTDETTYHDAETGEEKNYKKDNAALHLVIAMTGHEVDEIGDIYFDDEVVELDENGEAVDSKFQIGKVPAIRVNKHLGHVNQLADATMVEEVEKWTENHRLRGCAYLYVRLIFDRNVWPNGIPNITALVKGKKLFDPRTGYTEYSDNWALVVRDYIANPVYGLGATAEEIDDAGVIAAANICDEDVPMLGGGTQPRYTCNGVVDTAKKPLDVLNELATAAAGTIVYAGGRFKIYPATFDASVATIDHSWLRGDIELQERPSQRDIFNTVRGIYVEPEKLYQPTDLPVYSNPVYVDQDNGRVVSEDFEFPFTTDVQRGQRLMKIFLESVRQSKTIRLQCNQKAMQLQVHDVVRFTTDLLGFEEKIFRVINWTLQADGAIDVLLKEEASTVYAFDPENDITLLAPSQNTNLPDERIVGAPGSPTIVEDLIETTGAGGLKPRVKVIWAESSDVFAVEYNVEYRLQGEADFVTAGQTKKTELTIYDMKPGVYEFRVNTISAVGVESEYTSAVKEVRGLAAPPADIENLSLNNISGNAHLVWDQVPDLDVKAGGKVRLRFTKDPVPEWSKGHEICDALPGIATNQVVPLIDGTYMAKAVDSAGNESVNATMVTAEQTALLNMNVVETLADSNANQFPGTKTNMFYNAGAGVLQLQSSALFDDQEGLFDDLPGLFDDVGDGQQVVSGEYIHSETFDLGYVGTFRVTADLRSIVFDAAQSFDDTSGLFDAREGLFDGGDIATVAARIMIRTTGDDPSGSPVWTPWRTFVSGEFTGRGAQFKVVFSSRNAAHNILVESLSFIIDMADVQNRGSVTTETGNDVAVAFNKRFNVSSPSLSFSITNMQAGDYIDHVNLSATGFDVSVRDINGDRVARQITYIAVGY